MTPQTREYDVRSKKRKKNLIDNLQLGFLGSNNNTRGEKEKREGHVDIYPMGELPIVQKCGSHVL